MEADPYEKGKRRILVLAPSLPHPTAWGFGIRVFHLIKFLAQRHEVALLAYAEPEDRERRRLLGPLGIAVHTVPPPPALLRKIRLRQALSLLTPRSYGGRLLHSPQFQSALSQLQHNHAFDIIQVESSPLAGFDFGTVPALLLDEHNLEYELLFRSFRSERAIERKVFNWMEFLKFRHEEQLCWRRVDGCIFTSSREESIVRRLAPTVSTAVVPNGVDVDYFKPIDTTVDVTSLVFSGLMSYRPNEDAVIYFVRQILPIILRRRPDVVFTIVGWGPTEEVRRLAGPNVVVTGRVSDVRPYLGRASAVVVPLRTGGGTRLKVVEGLAMGRPMVSTALGSEGINLVDGEHLLIRDAPSDFAEAVLRLLADRECAERLGVRGRALVTQEYSWQAVGQALEGFHSKCLQTKERSGVSRGERGA